MMKPSMTYEELLTQTAQKKRKAVKELNNALNSPTGFLVRAEIERDPGMVAWLWLVKEFCEALADHVGEWMEYYGNAPEAYEIATIYMMYEDSDPDLYNYLPVEAQLFTE